MVEIIGAIWSIFAGVLRGTTVWSVCSLDSLFRLSSEMEFKGEFALVEVVGGGVGPKSLAGISCLGRTSPKIRSDEMR